MGKPNRLRTKERQLPTILRRLPQTEHRCHSRLVFTPHYGWLYWFSGWCLHLFDSKRQLGILVRRNRWMRPQKTTSTSHRGLYQFNRMTLGLKNSLATFRSAMDVILPSVKLQSTLVYLENNVVFSKTVHDHPTHLRQVLTLLLNAGVTVELKMLFICRDHQLLASRHTTRTVGNCGNNVKRD